MLLSKMSRLWLDVEAELGGEAVERALGCSTKGGRGDVHVVVGQGEEGALPGKEERRRDAKDGRPVAVADGNVLQHLGRGQEREEVAALNVGRLPSSLLLLRGGLAALVLLQGPVQVCASRSMKT